MLSYQSSINISIHVFLTSVDRDGLGYGRCETAHTGRVPVDNFFHRTAVCVFVLAWSWGARARYFLCNQH